MANVKFDCSDAKHAANVESHMRTVIGHIRQVKDKHGDCRQDIADALETESHVAPEAPNVLNFWNMANRQDNPEAWEVAQDLIRIQHGEEC